MATIIERDNSSASAVLIFVLFVLLVIGGTWFAYTNGMLGHAGQIENKTVIVPVPTPTAPPAK
jgi:hypothetical protein